MSRAFRFRLAVPLRLALVRRDEQRRELGEQYRTCRALESRIGDVHEQRREVGRELETRGRAGLAASELVLLKRRAEVLGKAEAQARRELREAQERLDDIRRRLEAGMREVQVLERLEEEARRRHRAEEERRRTLAVDDLVLMRRARQAQTERSRP